MSKVYAMTQLAPYGMRKGISHIDKGAVYSISDTIAWSYNNDLKLSGIIFKDLRKELQVQ